MDSKRCPQEKLKCITKCSKNIFEAIKYSKVRIKYIKKLKYLACFTV